MQLLVKRSRLSCAVAHKPVVFVLLIVSRLICSTVAAAHRWHAYRLHTVLSCRQLTFCSHVRSLLYVRHCTLYISTSILIIIRFHKRPCGRVRLHETFFDNFSDHISSVLRQLHWLPVRQRVVFKIATLVYRSLSGRCPGLPCPMIASWSPTLEQDNCVPQTRGH